MACKKIKKLLERNVCDSNSNNGPSKNEDKTEKTTTQMTEILTSRSAASSTSAALNDFQKKILFNYEKSLNQNCNYKQLRELNPNVEKLDEDILYHIALGNKSHDLQKMFKDVKFIVMGGTPKRMEQFAYYIMNEIGYELQPGTLLNDISKHSHRYAMYKVGPVMSVSHGMGMPSIGILLHELIKLAHHAGMMDPIFVRIGTCGGFSRKGGTVVVSDEVVNDYMESIYELSILGTSIRFPAVLNQCIAKDLTALGNSQDNFEIIKGKTYCTDNFYDGSGRCDGAVCEFSDSQGLEYYKSLERNGVVNVEMESLAFAALTCRAGIKSAVIAVILSDRLETDQIKQPKEVLDEWQTRPQRLLARYIKKVLAASGTDLRKIISPVASKSMTEVPSTQGVPQSTQRPTATIATPGVTPAGRVVCPPLPCGKQFTGVPTATTQPSAVTSSQPATSVCKPICQKRPITGMGAETTRDSTKPTSAVDSVKSTMAAAKAESQGGWRSCYKTCGIGSEQADVGTPQVDQQQTTMKPTVAAGAETFDCHCDATKVIKPDQTPTTTMPVTTERGRSSSCASCETSASTSTTASSVTSIPSYKAKDFDSSTKSIDPNESRTARSESCLKSGVATRQPSATFSTPMQEQTKGAAAAESAEKRPCCLSRSPRTVAADHQKYIEDRLNQESYVSPSQTPSATLKRTSIPKPLVSTDLGPCCTGKSAEAETPVYLTGVPELGPCCKGLKKESPLKCPADPEKCMEDRRDHKLDTFTPKPSTGMERSKISPRAVTNVQLGPCCSGKIPIVSQKEVLSSNLGPCCIGQNTEISPEECTDGFSLSSETFESTSREDYDEPLKQPFSDLSTPSRSEDKGQKILTDCPLRLKSKCNIKAFTDNGLKVFDPSSETPDPRLGTKSPVFWTTPIPGSKVVPETLDHRSTKVSAFATPTVASDRSCCPTKEVRPVFSSAKSLKLDGPCCPPFTSSGASSFESVDSKNGPHKSAASGSKFGAETNKYDESPSPCAACKKFQDSKIIFTGGTPSVSQPEIIKCPHKLKRLKEECQGYD